MSRFLSCVLLFISFSVFGQEAFFSTRSNVMNNATNQWLVAELEKNNPSAFSDNQSGKSVIRIPAGTAAVAQLNSTYDVALANKFSRIYFPEGKADRFLKINSLCNLYFPLVERKLLNAKLPLEYKYLPLVMTGFNTSYEDERDRGGMWHSSFLPLENGNYKLTLWWMKEEVVISLLMLRSKNYWKSTIISMERWQAFSKLGISPELMRKSYTTSAH